MAPLLKKQTKETWRKFINFEKITGATFSTSAANISKNNWNNYWNDAHGGLKLPSWLAAHSKSTQNRNDYEFPYCSFFFSFICPEPSKVGSELAILVFVVQIHVLFMLLLFNTTHFKKQVSLHASRPLVPSRTATPSASSAFVTFCLMQSGCTCFSRRSHLICRQRCRKMTVTFWYLEKPPPSLDSAVISCPFPQFFFTLFFIDLLIRWFSTQNNPLSEKLAGKEKN